MSHPALPALSVEDKTGNTCVVTPRLLRGLPVLQPHLLWLCSQSPTLALTDEPQARPKVDCWAALCSVWFTLGAYVKWPQN